MRLPRGGSRRRSTRRRPGEGGAAWPAGGLSGSAGCGAGVGSCSAAVQPWRCHQPIALRAMDSSRLTVSASISSARAAASSASISGSAGSSIAATGKTGGFAPPGMLRYPSAFRCPRSVPEPARTVRAARTMPPGSPSGPRGHRYRPPVAPPPTAAPYENTAWPASPRPPIRRGCSLPSAVRVSESNGAQWRRMFTQVLPSSSSVASHR